VQHSDDVLTGLQGACTSKQLVADDNVYRSLRERFADYFDPGGMGPSRSSGCSRDGVRREQEFLRDQIENGKGTRRLKAIKAP